MTETNILELAELLNESTPFRSDDERRLALAIYEELATGQPAAPEVIARCAGLDATWVHETLDGWTGVYRDDAGRVIGFWGLALHETDHRFQVDDQTLYTWCAWDPMFLAPVLGKDATVTSTCPVTGRTITLVVGPNGIRDIDPPTAVLSFLQPTPNMGADVINSFCHYVRLFASRDAADEWAGANPATFVLGLHDAFELGRLTLGRLGGARA